MWVLQLTFFFLVKASRLGCNCPDAATASGGAPLLVSSCASLKNAAREPLGACTAISLVPCRLIVLSYSG